MCWYHVRLSVCSIRFLVELDNTKRRVSLTPAEERIQAQHHSERTTNRIRAVEEKMRAAWQQEAEELHMAAHSGEWWWHVLLRQHMMLWMLPGRSLHNNPRNREQQLQTAVQTIVTERRSVPVLCCRIMEFHGAPVAQWRVPYPLFLHPVQQAMLHLDVKMLDSTTFHCGAFHRSTAMRSRKVLLCAC